MIERDVALARLRAALTEGPPLRLAVLFGSHADGRPRAESDYDVGIIPADASISLHDELMLGSSLSGAVSAEVDLVRLDGDNPLLGAEVARKGVCLFEAEPGVFAAYRADAMSTWIDFEETIAPHRERFLQRLRGLRPATDVPLVTRKLATLDEHLRRVVARRPSTPAALGADALLQDAISKSVLVVVQEAMDIALHVASDGGWEVAPTYREAFVVLARHGVISDELAASLGGAAQLRNRIAHGYASVDAERLRSDLPDGIAAFGAFSRAVAELLAR